jgi:putative transposase
MPRYRRANVEGGIYFLTLVTHQRAPLFLDSAARRCLREAIAQAREAEVFESIDMVLLPDHLHLLIRLPENDDAFSSRVSRIKTSFTRAWLSTGGTESAQSSSRDRQGYRGVWQKRFWEHLIRSPADLNRCREYIYCNAVKHGLCRCPHEWEWSSLHRAVRAGDMPADWRCTCDGRRHDPPPEFPDAEMDS